MRHSSLLTNRDIVIFLLLLFVSVLQCGRDAHNGSLSASSSWGPEKVKLDQKNVFLGFGPHFTDGETELQ